jgi:hypothetical protein
MPFCTEIRRPKSEGRKKPDGEKLKAEARRPNVCDTAGEARLLPSPNFFAGIISDNVVSWTAKEIRALREPCSTRVMARQLSRSHVHWDREAFRGQLGRASVLECGGSAPLSTLSSIPPKRRRTGALQNLRTNGQFMEGKIRPCQPCKLTSSIIPLRPLASCRAVARAKRVGLLSGFGFRPSGFTPLRA